jgi:hypothetical protein
MTEIRTSSVSGVELLVPLDRDAEAALHRQVETAIRDAIGDTQRPPKRRLRLA